MTNHILMLSMFFIQLWAHAHFSSSHGAVGLDYGQNGGLITCSHDGELLVCKTRHYKLQRIISSSFALTNLIFVYTTIIVFECLSHEHWFSCQILKLLQLYLFWVKKYLFLRYFLCFKRHISESYGWYHSTVQRPGLIPNIVKVVVVYGHFDPGLHMGPFQNKRRTLARKLTTLPG